MPLKYVSEFDMCKCALCVVQHCTSSCVTEGKHEIGAFSDFRRELALHILQRTIALLYFSILTSQTVDYLSPLFTWGQMD